MERIKVIMIIMLLMVSIASASFTYSLTTDKEKYKTDEPIFIYFSVTNETGGALIWAITEGTLGAKMTNATDEVVWSSPQPEVFSMIFMQNKLLPGQTFELNWAIESGLPHGKYELEGMFFGLDHTEYRKVKVAPEPSTMILLSLGLIAIRKKKNGS